MNDTKEPCGCDIHDCCPEHAHETRVGSGFVVTEEPASDSCTALVLSLQKQVADLRKNAREYARNDLMGELWDDIRRKSFLAHLGKPVIYEKDVLDLLTKYSDPK